MKKNILKLFIMLLIGVSATSTVFAGNSSGTYSGSFSMTHMIVAKQELYLSGNKTINGTVNLTSIGSDKVGSVKLTANIVQKTWLGYKYYKSVNAGTLVKGSRSFNLGTKKYSADNYLFALEQNSGFTVKGKFTVKWK